jgi:hypothetical protein
MLDISFKFLIMPKTCSRLTKSTNIALELKHWHNSFRSLELLIEFLESYLELSI